jgi:hypothetical protein
MTVAQRALLPTSLLSLLPNARHRGPLRLVRELLQSVQLHPQCGRSHHAAMGMADRRPDSEGPVNVELPMQWMWDIIDEFIWQFGSYSAWRSKTRDKNEDEIDMLQESPQVHRIMALSSSLLPADRSGARTRSSTSSIPSSKRARSRTSCERSSVARRWSALAEVSRCLRLTHPQLRRR